MYEINDTSIKRYTHRSLTLYITTPICLSDFIVEVFMITVAVYRLRCLFRLILARAEATVFVYVIYEHLFIKSYFISIAFEFNTVFMNYFFFLILFHPLQQIWTKNLYVWRINTKINWEASVHAVKSIVLISRSSS